MNYFLDWDSLKNCCLFFLWCFFFHCKFKIISSKYLSFSLTKLTIDFLHLHLCTLIRIFMNILELQLLGVSQKFIKHLKLFLWTSVRTLSISIKLFCLSPNWLIHAWICSNYSVVSIILMKNLLKYFIKIIFLKMRFIQYWIEMWEWKIYELSIF